jgi:hypothetical protein
MEPLANKQVDLAKVDQPHIDGDFLALVDVSHSAPSCLLLGRVSPSHGMVEGVATSETGPGLSVPPAARKRLTTAGKLAALSLDCADIAHLARWPCTGPVLP